jgi:cyclophilin family peptidyl-prolyl cis-trans isomerase
MRRILHLVIISILTAAGSAQCADSLGVNAEAYADSQVVLSTSLGEVVLDLFPDVAPKHVTSFVRLINMGFYDSLTFHRIIKETLIQGGFPKGDSLGKGPWNVPAEFSNLKHTDGTLAMARSRDFNSASCQFYIGMRPMPFLDGKYTIFGHVADSASLAVVHQIGSVKTTGKQPYPKRSDFPLEPVYIKKAYLRLNPGVKTD